MDKDELRKKLERFDLDFLRSICLDRKYNIPKDAGLDEIVDFFINRSEKKELERILDGLTLEKPGLPDEIVQCKAELEEKTEKTIDKAMSRVNLIFGGFTSFLTVVLVLIGGGSYLSIENADKVLEETKRYSDSFESLEKEKAYLFSRLYKSLADNNTLNTRLKEQNQQFINSFLALIAGDDLEEIIIAIQQYNSLDILNDVLLQDRLIKQILQLKKIVAQFEKIESMEPETANFPILDQCKKLIDYLGKFVEPTELIQANPVKREKRWTELNNECLDVASLNTGNDENLILSKYMRMIRALLIHRHVGVYMGIPRAKSELVELEKEGKNKLSQLIEKAEKEDHLKCARQLSEKSTILVLKNMYGQFCTFNELTYDNHDTLADLETASDERKLQEIKKELEIWKESLIDTKKKLKKITCKLKEEQEKSLNLIRGEVQLDNELHEEFGNLTITEIKGLHNWGEDLLGRIANNLAAIFYYGSLYNCFKKEEQQEMIDEGLININDAINTGEKRSRRMEQANTIQTVTNYFYITKAELLLLKFLQEMQVDVQKARLNTEELIKTLQEDHANRTTKSKTYEELINALKMAGNIFDLYYFNNNEKHIETILYDFKNLTHDGKRIGDYLGTPGK